jgi:hypothetical protein
VAYSDYERFKWEVLAHTFHRLGLEAPWWEVREIEPNDHDRQAALVCRVVFDLFDSGLVFGAYASRDEGYSLALEEFVSVSREVIAEELGRPLDACEPEDRLFWLLPTEKADEVWRELPPEAFLRSASSSKRED